MNQLTLTGPKTMRQAVIRAADRFEVEDAPLPTIRAEGEIVVAPAVAGLCSGDLMPWYLERKVGKVLGHEMAGTAVQVGRAVRGIAEGDLVFAHHHAPCLACPMCHAGDTVQCDRWRLPGFDPGGMAQRVRIPEHVVRVDAFRLDGVDADRGVFIEPLGCCVKALERVDRRRTRRAVVVGCGVMGLLNAMLTRATGPEEVVAIEPQPDRAEFARRLGADRVLHPDDARRLLAAGRFEPADFVVIGPGFPEVIRSSLDFVRPGGAAVLFAPTPPGEPTPLDLHDLYFREIRLVPAYSCGPDETRRAYELLRGGRIDPTPLITHRFGLEEVQEAYDAAAAGGACVKCVIDLPT